MSNIKSFIHLLISALKKAYLFGGVMEEYGKRAPP